MSRTGINRWRWFFLSSLLACSLPMIHRAAAPLKPARLAFWLAAQTNLQTWSADFVQTRTLKALAQPLTATGRVWFAAPQRFRWELGSPAQTIAVRKAEELLILYPKLKRAERYPLDETARGPWRDALALLEAGFPRSQTELEARFKILSLQESDAVAQLVLQPKSATARRLMPQIQIEFSPADGSLRATQLTFADGSTMRNDFTNAVVNPALEEGLFNPALPAEMKIVEP